MNQDLKNLLTMVIKAGIEQGILGRASRVTRKEKVGPKRQRQNVGRAADSSATKNLQQKGDEE